MPAQFPDTEIGDAALAAVTHQMHRSLRGYGWVSGGPATAGPGVAVTVPSDTTMWIDGTDVDVVDGENVAELVTHDRHPRWASIVVNEDGSITAEHSSPDRPLEIDGEELTGRSGARPQPPIVTDGTRVLHSLVWVPANASAIASEDILDRRIDARVDAYNFSIDGFTESEAVAAVEAEDPLDLSGVLNTGGDINAGGAVVASDSGSDITLLNADNDAAIRANTSNGSQGRIAIRQNDTNDVYLGDLDETGGSTYLRVDGTNAVEIDAADSSVSVVDGEFRVTNGPTYEQGSRLATRAWVQGGFSPDNHDNTEHSESFVFHDSAEYEIQKDGSDGSGIINFKTS